MTKQKEVIMKRLDTVYYARILDQVATYEICELRIRTIEDDYFVGIDKRDKHAYLFSNDELNKKVFYNRSDALRIIKEAEKNKRVISNETYYEED